MCCMPSKIGYLTCRGSIRVLYLSDNALTGTILSEISMLTKLNAVDLQGNRLTGTIPVQISALAELQGTEPAKPGLFETLQVQTV